jgi:phosphoglycerol transferase MdoB-like AlkP superfamily enzyme
MIPNELEAKVKENHTVPIIFYGKSVENLKREIPSMTHLDIMPTLLDMVAPKDFKYKSWGNSIFANERRLQPMNTEVITLNNKILLINSTDCPQEYKELHRMYMALAYYRSISDGSLKQE